MKRQNIDDARNLPKWLQNHFDMEKVTNFKMLLGNTRHILQ